jgi:hypothetical protein
MNDMLNSSEDLSPSQRVSVSKYLKLETAIFMTYNFTYELVFITLALAIILIQREKLWVPLLQLKENVYHL